jgi:hypothetical protein
VFHRWIHGRISNTPVRFCVIRSGRLSKIPTAVAWHNLHWPAGAPIQEACSIWSIVFTSDFQIFVTAVYSLTT